MKMQEKTPADILEAAGVRLLDEEALRDWPPKPEEEGDEAEGRDGLEGKGGDGGKGEVTAEAGKPSFLFFTAQWCEVCLESAPRFAGIFERFRDRAEFRQVDADRAPVATERLGVRSVPAVVAFARGREIARRVRLAAEAELERFVEDAVKEAEAGQTDEAGADQGDPERASAGEDKP